MPGRGFAPRLLPVKEMYHTFNMGIGMVLIVSPHIEGQIRSRLSRFNLDSWIIGRIVRGKQEVEII